MAVLFSSALADTAAAVATFLVVVYLYFSNAFKYWQKKGVPYLQPTFLFGNIGGIILQTEYFGELLKRAYDDQPGQPVVGLFAMKKPFLLVRDIEIVRRVIAKDSHFFLDRSTEPSKNGEPLFARSIFVLKGKKWRHMRMKLTPTFTSGKMKKMFYLINECGKKLRPTIDQEMSKGTGVVVKDTVARYSTDVIASCAFGINAKALEDPNCEFRVAMRKLFVRSRAQQLAYSITLSFPWLVKLLGLNALDNTDTNYLRKTFWEVAEYRKNTGVVRNDVVDILLQMKEVGHIQVEDENDLNEIKQDPGYMNKEPNRRDKLDIKLDNDDYVSQAYTFIAAGFETSSSVVSFTLFELALNPCIQEKLRKEIQAVLDKHNSEVTYDSLVEMSYLDMVVSESLRKYPTLPFLERKCLSDYRIPGTDITIEKGTRVMVSVLGIHMDPEIHSEPEIFDPERFSHENVSKRSNFAYLPFGEGPRMCLGKRFGLMQVKTALVYILTNYQVKPCAETPQPPLGMNPTGSTNNPKKAIVLAFENIK